MANCSRSTLDIGSDEIKDHCCSACEEQSMEICADFYCETCLKLYCKKCIHHHGLLFKKHTPYGRNRMNKWPVSKKVKDFLLMCAMHKGETLNMMCNDHSQLCCRDCAFLYHRQCSSVELISEKKTKTTDLQQLSTKLEYILHQLNNLHKKQEATIQSVQGSYDEQLQLVWEARRKINAALDKIEKNTLNEMKDTLTRLQASLKSDVKKCTRLQNDLKRFDEAIPEIRDKNRHDLSFIVCHKGLYHIKEADKYLEDYCIPIECSITFYADQYIEQYLSSLSGIGCIFYKPQPLLRLQTNNDVFVDKSKKLEKNVKIPCDSAICSIVAICVLPHDHILVADKSNKKIKLLGSQYEVISHFGVSGYPEDICQMTHIEVAITVNDANTHWVQFITVSNGQLLKGRKLQLPHHCAGIAQNRGDMYITSTTALYKYSISGKLIKNIYQDTSNSNAVYRCAVSSNGDNIYITNRGQDKLLTLSRDGTVLSIFSDPELKEPTGIHFTTEGQVLVCFCGSHTIIQLGNQGSRKVTTLVKEENGSSGPESVFYINRDQLIVGYESYNNLVLYRGNRRCSVM